MRKLFILLFSLTLFAVLTGCGPVYKRHFEYNPPASPIGQMCTTQCIQNRSTCQQMCQMRSDQCRSQAQLNAYSQYEAYKHERMRANKPLKKTLSDFDNSAFCSTSCNCTPAYNSCYSACGGKIVEKQVCVAFCNKN